MRKLGMVAAAAVVLSLGLGAKPKDFQEYEKKHYQALKVWFTDKKEVKAYQKLKTPGERDQWLKDIGYWDRFYQYDEYDQEAILGREPKIGWKQDMVYMAWGAPFRKTKTTKRTAANSLILTYRMEVTKDGAHMVWAPKSKETYKAVSQYQTELIIDDNVVTDILEKDAWE